MATIIGDSGANTLQGGDSNDTLQGRGGNDRLVGGKGVDTASYAGALASYVIGTAGGALSIRDVNAANGDDGTDRLFDIEKLAFASGGITVTHDTIVDTTPSLLRAVASTTVLADGGYLVTWWDSGDGTLGNPGAQIRARLFDASGHAIRGDVLVGLSGQDGIRPLPAIPLPNGGYLNTWTSPAPDEADHSPSIYALRHDAFGTPHGVFQISDAHVDEQSSTTVANLADGSSIVAWTAVGQEPGARSAGIYARHFDTEGNTTRPEFRVNTLTDGDQYSAAAAPLANGGYVVIWGQGESPPPGFTQVSELIYDNLGGISMQRFDADDQKVGDEILVTSLPGAVPEQVRVDSLSGMPDLYGFGALAALHGGGFVVAFTYLLASFIDPVRSNIALVHFDDDGNVVGSPNQQVADTPALAAPGASGANLFPALAGLADGGYVVVWYASGGGRPTGLEGQRYDAGDHPVGDAFWITTDDGNEAIDRPAVTALADGGFLVTWAAHHHVHAQRYDADGNAVGMKVTGTAGADILNVGDAHFLTVDGAGGNDQLNGGSSDDTLLGGAGVDSLNGNSGNDWLDGGSGADRMVGGNGGDTYVVDDTRDTVVENGSGGVDAVIASIGYTLGAGLERLTLTGSANIAAVGNALANVIVGNSGNNAVNGGAGADTLAGAFGNDTYFVDNVQDRVIEHADGGTDTVRASVSFTLADDVEHLIVLGTAAIDGAGNALANRIGGNSGNNVLDGDAGNDVLSGGGGRDRLNGDEGDDRLSGGLGIDTLAGGTGHDVFVFNAPAGASNADTVLDFEPGSDGLELALAYFGGANNHRAGTLAANDFVVVHDRVSGFDTHHVLYAETSGKLYYNADGRGGLPAVLIATFDDHPALTAADIHLA